MHTFPALVELTQEYHWFPVFVEAIARRIMSVVNFAVRMRLYVGGFLSISDMVSDVLVVRQYLESASTRGYAYASLSMLAASIVLQLGVVIVQYSKAARAKFWREMALVLTGLKPAVDAWRVGTGGQDAQTADQSLNAYDELVMVKMCEGESHADSETAAAKVLTSY